MMIDSPAPRTSRRSALKGLGIIGGAAAVGLGGDWGAGAAEARVGPGPVGTDDAPLAGRTEAVGALLATSPGLTYATFGMFAFQPNLFANGYSVSGTGCFSSTMAGYVVANLDLPTGAIVKEVAFAGQNSSGAPASFFVERYSLDGGGSTTIADVLIPSGAATIQSASVAVNHVVDSAFSYDAAGFTSSVIRMYSCRIGFAGPFGPIPLNPQARKLDTRFPGPLTGKFQAGKTRTLTLSPELPAGAAAALLNVTVTDTVGSGFLIVYPAGTTRPGTSNINWFGSGQTIANNATVAVSAGGAVQIYCGGGGAPQAHVIVDLLGYLT